MYSLKTYPYQLRFKKPSGTSRGILTTKTSWFIELWETNSPEVVGVGECGLLQGLSADDRPNYQQIITSIQPEEFEHPSNLLNRLKAWPSIQAGIEMALLDLKHGGKRLYFKNDFTYGNQPISINGLIWMGSKTQMLHQIESKIKAGFNCIKMKIGAIDFEEELACIRHIRNHFSKNEIELRVDANGAFSLNNALEKLEKLAGYDIHSIEQPIKPGQHTHMARLCEKTPLPIALDEELIGVFDGTLKAKLLEDIKPQFVILKPSFIGGFTGTDEWISSAENLGIPYWITSALESNIGLDAIAQYAAEKDISIPQGLGTGGLFINNLQAPLHIEQGHLHRRYFS